MAFKLTIAGTDFTKYLVPTIQPVLDDELNSSKFFNFAIYPADNNFGVVTQNQFVRLTSNQGTVFTGYVTATPLLTIVAPQFAGYNVTAQSEEWAFNNASFGIVPDFVGTFAGDILKSLIQLAAPNTHLNLSFINKGPFVGTFSVEPAWTFATAASALAKQVGFRWWILDNIVHFEPQNDAPYGYSIDATSPGFIANNLNLTPSNVPIVNDVTINGPTEPQLFIEEDFWGDGLTSVYNTSNAVFGRIDIVTIFNDYYRSAVLDPTLWVEIDPHHHILYARNNLTVTGSDAALGSSLLFSTSTFELAGELLFDHGTFSFNAISVGVLGGLYKDNSFVGSSCVAGFYCSGGPQTTILNAFINGNIAGSTVTTQSNHSYRLRTYVSSDSAIRYNSLFRSITGQFGGQTVPSDAYLTLVVLDTDLSNPTAPPVVTTLYDQKLTNIPAFAYYALFNSLGLFFTSTVGPVVSRLPYLRVRSTVSGKITNPTLNQDPVTQIFTVALPFSPSTSEGISIRYRKPGNAISRLKNPNNIVANGVKAVIINTVDGVRTSTDCENLAQSYLLDHGVILYEGSYKTAPISLGLVPQSGRYIAVNQPAVTTLFVSIVREYKLSLVDINGEQITLETTFGFAPLINNFPSVSGSGSLAALDFTTVPQFLEPNPSINASGISAAQITANCVHNPLGTYEVRTSDANWGQGGGGNFVQQSTSASFNISRVSHTDLFYLRELDSGFVPKSSRFSTLLLANGYPLTPPSPSTSSSIFIGSNIIYTIILTSTADVYGVEIRATDNTTVVYHSLFNSSADLTFVQPNPGGITVINNYNFYTFNSHGDYSLPTVISGTTSTVPAPNPPTGLTFVATDYVKAGDGTIIAEATVDWTASTTTDVTYLIRYVTHGNTNYSYLAVSNATIATITGLAINTSYDVAVCAVGAFQQQSAFTTTLQINTAPSTTAPTTPSGLSATGGFRVIALNWTPNVELDLAGYIVQFSTNNIAFTTIATVYTSLFVDKGDASRGELGVSTTYYYKIAAYNTNGQASSFTASVNATTTQIGTTDIAANSITGNMIQANTITAGKIISVNASAVSGVLVPGNVPGLDASKIISGIFSPTSLIPNLDFSKITTGTLWGQNITSTTIDGNHITTGTVTANQLAAISRFSISKSIQFTGDSSGLVWTAGYLIVPDNTGVNTMYTISAQASPITTPAAGKAKYIYFSASTSTTILNATADVTDGTIPTLTADSFVIAVWHGLSDITVFSGQTIIDGGHIQTNTITANKISAVNASAVTGVLVPGNVPGLDASKIISGTFSPTSLIPNLDFSKITTGTLWGQNITSTTIDGNHITTGTVTANQLAAVARFSISKSIQFTGDSSGLVWTAGYLIVPNSSGVNTMYTISAQGSPITTPAASNAKYIYFSASTSTTALQFTADVADGTIPTLTSDAFVIAVWHGLSDITVFSGQTIIDGGHIQTNTITANKISTVNASSVTGVLVPGNVPGLDASKIISGTFSPTSLIPNLDFSKITTGTLWGQNITSTTIDGSHITTGTVTANQLAAVARFSISKSIKFTGDGSGLVWTAGYLIVPDSSGTNTMYSISAQGSPIATPAGGKAKYIYFSASTSTTALQFTADVTDGTIPTLTSDAFVIAVWHGGADVTVFSGQTIIDGGHIQASSITSDKINTSGITVGGGSGVAGVVNVQDATPTTVGFIGTFGSTQFGGTAYGAWFKTLGVGGTVNTPNLYADTSGNLIFANGTIKSVEFSGAQLNSDGSISNANQIRSSRILSSVPSGTTLNFVLGAQKNSSSDNLGIDVGVSNFTLSTGTFYRINWNNSNNFVLSKVISGTLTTLASGSYSTSDTNVHTITLTIVTGATNTLRASIDGQDVLATTDNSISLTSMSFALLATGKVWQMDLLSNNVEIISDGPSRKARTGVHSTYRPLTNPLRWTYSGSGTTGTINIDAFTMRVGPDDFSINSGSITSSNLGGLSYIYYDDVNFAGGAVTFVETTIKEVAIQGTGRFFVGSVYLPYFVTGATTDYPGNNDGGSGARGGSNQIFRASTYTTIQSGGAVAGFSGNITSVDDNQFEQFTIPGNSSISDAFAKVFFYGIPTGAYSKATITIRYQISLNNISPNNVSFNVKAVWNSGADTYDSVTLVGLSPIGAAAGVVTVTYDLPVALVSWSALTLTFEASDGLPSGTSGNVLIKIFPPTIKCIG
jgi:hypothetical protein